MTNLDLAFWQVSILFIGTLLSSELLFGLPLVRNIKHLHHLLRRIIRTLRSSRISDHWKEQVTVVYAAHLLGHSLLLPSLLLVALFPLAVGLWIATESRDALVLLSLDWRILLGITTLSILYLFVRKHFNA
jgi:Na+/H+ antiporter NhaC